MLKNRKYNLNTKYNRQGVNKYTTILLVSWCNKELLKSKQGFGERSLIKA